MAKTKVLYEQFKSIDHLLQTMGNRQLNDAYSQSNYEIASDRFEQYGGFSKVQCYHDALMLLKDGYKEPLDKIKKAVLKIGEASNHKRPRMKNDYVGYVPNVPNMLMNLPITMINKEKVPNKKHNTMHIVYSFTSLGDVHPDRLVHGGINLISLINSLEKQNIRVKLDIMFCSTANNTTVAYTVNVKEYQQNLNLLKLSFPLVHPSMLRRISFKWLETLPNLKEKKFTRGYGVTLGAMHQNDSKQEKKMLLSDGIIKDENTIYFNVYDAMRSNDMEQLAKRIGLLK